MSRFVDAKAAYAVTGSCGPQAPAIYFVDMMEHHFPVKEAAANLGANVIAVPILSWDDSLTPWPAPGLYEGDADFKGLAGETLGQLVGESIPQIEAQLGLSPSKRAICGYSLGGLFSLYAFTHSDAFAACAALSPSVWYEGWIDHLANTDIDLSGKHAFLSIGSKEKRAMPAILHCVEDNVVETGRLLESRGCETQVSIGPGNHMQYGMERISAGLADLDGWLGAKPLHELNA